MSADAHDRGLAYYLPEPDKPRTVLRVPGAHTLYIGPSGCMRRHALHELEYANERQSSYLLLSEVDLISGDYEDHVGDAIEVLLSELLPAPRVLFLTVFCIDSLLGTDEEAMLARLGERFQGLRFIMEHIDPMSLDEKLSMATKKQTNLHSLLEPVPFHDDGVNFIGNLVSLDPACEFLDLLSAWGAQPVRELHQCRAYDEYQAMAKSRLTIVLRFMAVDSAVDMQERLGIPFIYLPTEYGVDKVVRGYQDVAALLGKPMPDFSAERERVLREVRKTRKVVGNTAVAVDSSAAMTPFAAARALLDYGFRVTDVFRSPHLFDADKEDELYLTSMHPEVRIHRSEDYANLLLTAPEKACVAIGADCARILRAPHFVDIWHDEGFYGFQGIRALMSLMRESMRVKTEWPELAIPGKS